MSVLTSFQYEYSSCSDYPYKHMSSDTRILGSKIINKVFTKAPKSYENKTAKKTPLGQFQ